MMLGGLQIGGFTPQAEAAVGVNQQINFQARLLNAQGATVPDGTYNIQFKIYQDGTGCVVSGTSPCGGTLLWTESWLNNTAQGVTVKNGYFSVYLGAIASLAAVDFNQDTLWLSLNIGSTAPTCTPFTSCGGDGEMLPFKRFASNPYALNSGKLGGLTSSQFVQIAPGSVQADSSTASSIFINKDNAAGNILQLQKAASDVFVVSNSGTTAINTNSVTALTVQNGSNNAFGVDTTNIKVAVGLATSAASSRLSIAGQGASNGLTLGDGATGSTNLYVSADDTLKTDDSLVVVGSISTLGSSSVTSGGAFIGPTSGNTINGLIVNTGALSGITSISLSGAISGGTTYSGSGDITSTAGSVVAATHTGSTAVTVSSGGSSALTLTSASGTAILGGSTNTIQRTNSTFALDVLNAGSVSTLNVTNSDVSQVANLNVDGGLNIGSGQTYKINNADINTAGTLTNVAYENQSNSFTSTNSFAGSGDGVNVIGVLFKNGSDSTTAFKIQNALANATILTADTSNVRVGVGTAAPQATLHVVGGGAPYTTYNGIDGTTATLGGSFLEQTVTDSTFTNPYRGSVNKTTVNFASDPGAKSVLGGYNEVGIPSGNATAMASLTLRANNNVVTHFGTGTLGTAGGLVTAIKNMSTGTITDAIALQGQIQNQSTGTMTRAYGLQVSNISNAGTIGDTYGVYIGTVTAGTQTNTPYAFYASDA
ncbi:MAG TPA: hypothetical protein VF272_02975, partial [Candidatus Saccharimonadia bacterium]